MLGQAMYWNSKPGQSANDVSWKRMHWRRSNSFVVIWHASVFVQRITLAESLTSVVHEHGSEVTNDVDDKKDRAILAPHRKVTATGISRYRCGS